MATTNWDRYFASQMQDEALRAALDIRVRAAR